MPALGLLKAANFMNPNQTENFPPHKPKLLERARDILRARYYSRRTEEVYLGWMRRFILFHHKRHPRELGEAEIAGFLSHPATERQVAAATQNQALSALLFLYKEVLRLDLGFIGDVERPQRLLGYDGQGRIQLNCQDSKTGRWHIVTLGVVEFLRRWRLHVLPKGLVRVRHYGLLSAAGGKLFLARCPEDFAYDPDGNTLHDGR